MYNEKKNIIQFRKHEEPIFAIRDGEDSAITKVDLQRYMQTGVRGH